jgi:DNA-binding XRE family transcriptional regulator
MFGPGVEGHGEMSRSKSTRNNVKTLREEVLMSKAELARRAGVSPLTIDRVESGLECRLDTKRKIILALGKKLEEKEEVFPALGDKRDKTSSSETNNQ